MAFLCKCKPPTRITAPILLRMVDSFCYHFMTFMDYRRAVGEWNVLQANSNVLAESQFAPSWLHFRIGVGRAPLVFTWQAMTRMSCGAIEGGFAALQSTGLILVAVVPSGNFQPTHNTLL